MCLYVGGPVGARAPCLDERRDIGEAAISLHVRAIGYVPDHDTEVARAGTGCECRVAGLAHLHQLHRLELGVRRALACKCARAPAPVQPREEHRGGRGRQHQIGGARVERGKGRTILIDIGHARFAALTPVVVVCEGGAVLSRDRVGSTRRRCGHQGVCGDRDIAGDVNLKSRFKRGYDRESVTLFQLLGHREATDPATGVRRLIGLMLLRAGGAPGEERVENVHGRAPEMHWLAMAKQKKPARMNTPWCSLAPAHVWQSLPAFSRAAPSTRFPTCRVPVGDRPVGQSACRLFNRSGGAWTPSVRHSNRLQAIPRPSVSQSQTRNSRALFEEGWRCTREDTCSVSDIRGAYQGIRPYFLARRSYSCWLLEWATASLATADMPDPAWTILCTSGAG